MRFRLCLPEMFGSVVRVFVCVIIKLFLRERRETSVRCCSNFRISQGVRKGQLFRRRLNAAVSIVGLLVYATKTSVNRPRRILVISQVLDVHGNVDHTFSHTSIC